MEPEDRYNASLTDEGHYRILLDAVPECAIYMMNTEGVVVSWNEGAQRLLGYETKEIVGENFSCFYASSDNQAELPRQSLAIASKERKFTGQCWQKRKNGTRFWAEIVIFPIRNPLGPLVGYAKITRDISEIRAVREALWRCEERFRLLVEGENTHGVYMLDPKGEISTWNTAAEQIHGYTADEIVGENFSRFYTEADRAAGLPKQVLETATKTGRHEKEGWRLRKNGTLIWTRVILDAIRDPDDNLIGFAEIVRDLSDDYGLPDDMREPAPASPMGE